MELIGSSLPGCTQTFPTRPPGALVPAGASEPETDTALLSALHRDWLLPCVSLGALTAAVTEPRARLTGRFIRKVRGGAASGAAASRGLEGCLQTHWWVRVPGFSCAFLPSHWSARTASSLWATSSPSSFQLLFYPLGSDRREEGSFCKGFELKLVAVPSPPLSQ